MVSIVLPDGQTDHNKHFVLESLLSALIITFYVMVSDTIHKFVENKTKRSIIYQYIVIFISMFVSTLVAIYSLYFFFGHNRCKCKKKRRLRCKK